MTDNDKPDAQPDTEDKPAETPAEASRPASPSAAPKGEKPRRRRVLHWGRWLFAVFWVGLTLAAGYGVWWVWQDLNEQRATVADLRETIAEQGETLERQDRELRQAPEQLKREFSTELDQARRGQSELLSSLEQRMNRVDRRLSAIASTNREDWKLAEAEYLLRLANQRLVLERDSVNALALAETADAILRDLGDSDLLPVRRALASDIEALKLADQVDREGIYLRLLALGEQLPTLPIVEPMRAPEGEGTVNDAQGEQAGGVWNTIKGSFQRMMERLSSHIRIRQHDKPIEALADPREQYLLRQQLQLMLEQAQAALLREQSQLYQNSLNRAADWIEAHFALNPQTETVMARLRELAEIDIAPELPDLDDALNLLETHIERQHRLSPGFQDAPAEEAES
ncbi:uroporphyrinogen-III C-methyltransferase [Marinimicrobium agarilyticum]|uniref:uroporphyrinogen-III C-methyltransferase n=1 Tax=Marinimicrobium agarilyticum TaxID=306546 RepID=UPI000427A3D3|nr:uroporphyrinogen-III C-methyltransferase [Marinimicrobium agarilyticum]